MAEPDLNGLQSYHFSIGSSGNISYGEMGFKSFRVQEVYIDGKQKGEYHIQPLGGKDPSSAVLYLRGFFPTCSVGLTDPSGLLNLEYPIYLVCKNDPMVMSVIPQIFEQIDEELNGKAIS